MIRHILFVGLSLMLVAACSNTMEGAGRDMQKAGKSVEDYFDKDKKY